MKYRKIPVEVEAVEFTGELPYPDGVHGLYISPMGDEEWDIQSDRRMVLDLDFAAFIETLEGRMRVSKGDWVITGVEGEKYPCKPAIFAKTYEPVYQEKITNPQ